MEDKWIIITDKGFMINNQFYESWNAAADSLIDIYVNYRDNHKLILNLEIILYSEFQKRIKRMLENATV